MNLNRANLRINSVCIGIFMLGGILGTVRSLSLASQQQGTSILARLSAAHRIHIENDWTGLSPFAPMTAHYTLERKPEGFRGEATFSAGGYSGPANKTVENIAVPLDRADLFLQMLSKCPMKSGDYEPKIEHTDDYPSIKLEIELENESVTFFTKSQGEGNTPWGVTIRGTTYVVESDIPAKALEMLEPHLKYAV